LCSGYAETEYVLSGGEPLLEWEAVRRIIKSIRTQSKRFILVQTNGILLDECKIDFFKKNNVGIEVGFDGTPETSARYRLGIVNHCGRIAKTICHARAKGLSVYSTMTVHPSQANKIPENYFALQEMGFDKIEITPAAFECWGKASVEAFKSGYLQVVKKSVVNRQRGSISLEYDRPMTGLTFDIIATPDNLVLANWALLALPLSQKRKFCLADFTGKDIVFNDSFIAEYAKRCSGVVKKDVMITYRDLSDINVAWVDDITRSRGGVKGLSGYLALSAFLKSINQKLF